MVIVAGADWSCGDSIRCLGWSGLLGMLIADCWLCWLMLVWRVVCLSGLLTFFLRIPPPPIVRKPPRWVGTGQCADHCALWWPSPRGNCHTNATLFEVAANMTKRPPVRGRGGHGAPVLECVGLLPDASSCCPPARADSAKLSHPCKTAPCGYKCDETTSCAGAGRSCGSCRRGRRLAPCRRVLVGVVSTCTCHLPAFQLHTHTHQKAHAAIFVNAKLLGPQVWCLSFGVSCRLSCQWNVVAPRSDRPDPKQTRCNCVRFILQAAAWLASDGGGRNQGRLGSAWNACAVTTWLPLCLEWLRSVGNCI